MLVPSGRWPLIGAPLLLLMLVALTIGSQFETSEAGAVSRSDKRGATQPTVKKERPDGEPDDVDDDVASIFDSDPDDEGLLPSGQSKTSPTDPLTPITTAKPKSTTTSKPKTTTTTGHPTTQNLDEDPIVDPLNHESAKSRAGSLSSGGGDGESHEDGESSDSATPATTTTTRAPKGSRIGSLDSKLKAMKGKAPIVVLKIHPVARKRTGDDAEDEAADGRPTLSPVVDKLVHDNHGHTDSSGTVILTIRPSDMGNLNKLNSSGEIVSSEPNLDKIPALMSTTTTHKPAAKKGHTTTTKAPSASNKTTTKMPAHSPTNKTKPASKTTTKMPSNGSTTTRAHPTLKTTTKKGINHVTQHPSKASGEDDHSKQRSTTRRAKAASKRPAIVTQVGWDSSFDGRWNDKTRDRNVTGLGIRDKPAGGVVIGKGNRDIGSNVVIPGRGRKPEGGAAGGIYVSSSRPDCQCSYKELKESDRMLAVVVTQRGGFKGRRLNTKALEKIMMGHGTAQQLADIAAKKPISVSTNNTFVLPAGHYYFPHPIRFAGFMSP